MNREIMLSEVSASLKTGDLILFHGIETSSKLIELIEWSYWSHIGMVVMPEDIGLEGTEPLLWESTSSSDGLVDVLLGVPKTDGPMLVSLSGRLTIDSTERFDTHFKVKYLSQPLQKDELNALKNCLSTLHMRTFPTDAQMLTAYVEGRRQNIPASFDSLFCSQLTAMTLMSMNMLSKSYVANGYCPKDFDEQTNFPKLKAYAYYDGARLKG
ncbi:hypothetical protein [Fusibacter bizertensis]